jgi:RHS repeat-associated protein
VQQCAANEPSGTTCLPATTFEYSNPANGFLQGQVLPTSPSVSSLISLLPMDINGDGRTDMAEAWKSSDRLQLMTYLSNGSALGNGTNQNMNVTAGEDGLIGADVTGDARGDVIMPVRRGSSLDFLTFLSNGSGFASAITTQTGQSHEHLAFIPADTDADGREDLVQVVDRGGKVTFLTYRSKGDGAFNAPMTSNTAKSKDNYGFLPIDLNGDGRVDIVQPQTSNNVLQFIVYYSNGNGLDQGPEVSTGRNPSKPEVEIADVNGDGKADLVLVENDGTISVTPFLSTGTGYRQVLAFTTPGGDNNRGLYSANLNGDARSDLFQAVAVNGNLQIIPFYSLSDRFTRGTPLTTSRTADTLGIKTMEIDGDGKQDLLSPEQSGGKITFAAIMSIPGQPDLLSKLTNGLGGQVLVRHVPMTDSSVYTKGVVAQYPVVDSSSPMPIVAQYTTTDGRGASYTFAYHYTEAQVGYSGIGWLGFREIRMTDTADKRASIVTYSQNYPQNGIVTASQVIDENLVTLTKSAIQIADIASAELQQKGIHQTVRTAEEMTMYDKYSGGAKLYTLRKTYDYDPFVNVSIIGDLGLVHTVDDDVFTCTRYNNIQSAWQLGYAAQELVTKTHARCLAFLSASDPAWDPVEDLRWEKKTYDSRTNPLSNGIYDDSHSTFLTTRFTVDEYGNRTSIADPAGDVTNITFDTTYHTFPRTITSPPNMAGTRLVDTFDYEPYYGNQTGNTDPNGNRFRWSVDQFGRVVDEYGPNPAGAEARIRNVSWGPDANGTFTRESVRPAWSSSDDVSTWSWSKTYIDGMERVYREEVRGIAPDKTVVQQIQFDSAGRPYRQSVPYFINDAPAWTVTTYDAYNRPITITAPDGTVEKLDYQLGALKLYRTSAYGTPDAQTEIDTFDVHGLITNRIMSNGAVYRYAYSRLGLLLKVNTLPDRRVVDFTYDSVGRMRSLNNPDSGLTQYHHDAQGWMTGQTDADGNTITFAFDKLGRVVTATGRTAEGTGTTRYTYDGPTANGLGNLTHVGMSADAVGGYSFDLGYDAYRQTASVRVTLPRGAYSYSMDYTPTGSVARHTYPDGTKLDIAYPVDGQPGTFALTLPGEQPETYITNADYNPYGTPLQTTYKNGVDIRRSFYPNDVATGKLKSISARSAAATLYSREITWNRVDLVTAFKDPAAPSNDATFTYDARKMGFLTRAVAAGSDQTFQYDSIGNRINTNSVPYTYYPGTDRLKTFGPNTNSEWNNNGTLKSITNGADTVNFTYTARGQVARAVKGSATGRYAYDFAGNALVQQPPGQNFTLYFIGSDYEISDYGNGNVLYTKYVEGLFGRTVAITSNNAGGSVARAIAQNNRANTDRLFGRTNFLARLGGAVLRNLAILLLAVLWSAAFCIALFLRLAAARRTADAPTDYVRRKPLYASLVPFVVVAFGLIAPAAHGDLTPGSNGPGNPTVGTLYFVQDLIGSTVSTTNANGAATAVVSYLAYGGVDQPRSSGIDNFRPKFSGKTFDHGLKDYDFGDRYYDPHTGRFTASDPEAQFVNPYVYAANSPVSFIDPNGDFAFLVAIVIGAIVGAYMGAAAVNHDYNPANWDWKSGKTYAGLFGGAIIGAVGGAIVEVAATAGVAAGIAGAMLVGAGENAAFTAMGGGSVKEVLISAAEGAAFGFVFGGAGAGVSRLISRFGRRGANVLAEAAEGVEQQIARGMRSTCSSFVAGTEVMRGDGSLQPIERLRVGAKVAAYHQDADRTGTFAVDATLDGETDRITRIVTASGNLLETTPAHLFSVYGMGWMRADELTPSLSLTSFDGSAVGITTVETRNEKRRVYNVSVETAEDYYVTSDRILVKNVAGACLIAKGITRPGWRKISKELTFLNQTIKSGPFKGYIRSAVDASEIGLRSDVVLIGKNNPRFITRWALDHKSPYKYLLWAAQKSPKTITWKNMIEISNYAPNLRYLTMPQNASHLYEPTAAAGRKGAKAIFNALGFW